MIYNNPMVENKSTAEFFANKFKPCGPTKTPDRMRPIIPGIFNFLSNIGESKIINNTSEKTNTGFFNGNSNSCIKL